MDTKMDIGNDISIIYYSSFLCVSFPPIIAYSPSYTLSTLGQARSKRGNKQKIREKTSSTITLSKEE